MTLIIGEDADYFLSVRDGEVIREVFSKYGSRDAVKQASQEVTQKLSLDKGYLDQHLSEAIELWEMGQSPFEDNGLGEFGSAYIRALVDGFVGERGRGLYILSVLVVRRDRHEIYRSQVYHIMVQH